MCLICKLTDAEAFEFAPIVMWRVEGFEPCPEVKHNEPAQDGIALDAIERAMPYADPFEQADRLRDVATRLREEFDTKYPQSTSTPE